MGGKNNPPPSVISLLSINTVGRADLLIWLLRRIDAKDFEVGKIPPREILSGERGITNARLGSYRPTFLISEHFSRFALLTPFRSIPIIEMCEILQQEAMDETVPTPNAP